MIKKNHLLWVEDDAMGSLSPLGRLFEREGFEVDVALDLKTALHRLERDRYSCVLVDLILPSGEKSGSLDPINGLKLIRKIREQEKREGRSGKTLISVLTVLNRSEVESEVKDFDIEFFNKVRLLERDEMARLLASLKAKSDAEDAAEQDNEADR